MDEQFKINFILIDGNLRIEDVSKECSFREMNVDFKTQIPYEFLLIIDQSTQKLIRKTEKLSINGCYKLIDARYELETTQNQSQTIANLNKENNNLQQQLKVQIEQAKSLEAEKAKISSELEQQNQQQLAVSDDLYKKEQMLAQRLQEDNQKIKQQIDNLREQWISVKQKNENFKKEIDQLRKEKQDLDEQNKADKKMIKDFEIKQQEYSFKQTMMNELKDKIKEYEKKFDSQIKEITEHKANEIIAQEKCKSIQNECEKENAIKAELRQMEKKSLEEKIQIINQEKEKLEKRLIKQKQTNEQRLQEKIQSYEEKISNLKDKTTKQKLKNEELKRQSQIRINQQEQINQPQVEEYEQLKQEYQTLEDQMQRLEEYCLEQEKLKKSLEEQLYQTSQENTQLKDECINFKLQYDQKNLNEESLNKQCTELKEENQKLKEIKIQQEQQIQGYQKQIEQQDHSYLQKFEKKEAELQNLKESATEAHYRHRLLRVIELIPRVYFSEIKFAIQNVVKKEALEKINNVMPQNYNVYEIWYTHNQVRNILFEPSNLELISFITLKETGISTGKCKQLFQSSNISADNNQSEIIDQLTIFQSQSFSQLLKTDQENHYQDAVPNSQMYALKKTTFSTKNDQTYQKFIEKNTKIEALKVIQNLIAAQVIQQEFNEELHKLGVQKLIKYQFAKFYIFSLKQSFKDILLQIDQQIEDRSIIPKGFLFIFDFVQDLQSDHSNSFYEYLIEEYQAPKIQKQQKKEVQSKPSYKDFFNTFLELLEIQSKIMEKIVDFTDEEIEEGLNFLLIQKQDYPTQYPHEIFYPTYQISFDSAADNQLTQYNGGYLTLEDDEESQYYCALSYYSIIKSHSQIGNYLYELVVSSYDGFFSNFDQGIKEMETCESKFKTSKFYKQWEDIFRQIKNKEE